MSQKVVQKAEKIHSPRPKGPRFSFFQTLEADGHCQSTAAAHARVGRRFHHPSMRRRGAVSNGEAFLWGDVRNKKSTQEFPSEFGLLYQRSKSLRLGLVLFLERFMIYMTYIFPLWSTLYLIYLVPKSTGGLHFEETIRLTHHRCQSTHNPWSGSFSSLQQSLQKHQ